MSPCLLNLHAQYIVSNARLDETQAGIKSARININNLRHTDDITLMAESEENLESLDESERGEWKFGLNLNIHKTKIVASSPITSRKIDFDTIETMRDFIFWGTPKLLQIVTAAMKFRHLLLGRKAIPNIAYQKAERLLCQQRSV